jgi:hypothetical protein
VANPKIPESDPQIAGVFFAAADDGVVLLELSVVLLDQE